jgi:hypothetical protein
MAVWHVHHQIEWNNDTFIHRYAFYCKSKINFYFIVGYGVKYIAEIRFPLLRAIMANCFEVKCENI